MAGSLTPTEAGTFLRMTVQHGTLFPPLTGHVIIRRGSHRRGFDGADIQSPDDNLGEIGRRGKGMPVWKDVGIVFVVDYARSSHSHYTSAAWEWMADSFLCLAFHLGC